MAIAMRDVGSKARALVQAALLAWGCVLAGPAALAAGPSTTLRIDGHVRTPATLDAADLAARPAVTQTDTFLAGTTPQTHTYVGTSLYGLVASAGPITDPAVKNDLLNQYVVATGSDGYRVVYSLGEIAPSFGNRAALLAYAETTNGVTAPLGADGFARSTAPGDVRGGRYVSNLVSLDVQASVATTAGTGGGLSFEFAVSGDVLRPASFGLAALQALPSRDLTIGNDVYTGVSFWDLLSTTVGLATDARVRNDVLGMYVVAIGSDGYRTLFSLGELSTLFGNQPDLIAYALNGQGLGANGFARLVVPGDAQRGRWVSNLIGLEVYHAVAAPVPEPETAALFGAGLLVLVVVSRRRRGSRSRP